MPHPEEPDLVSRIMAFLAGTLAIVTFVALVLHYEGVRPLTYDEIQQKYSVRK